MVKCVNLLVGSTYKIQKTQNQCFPMHWIWAKFSFQYELGPLRHVICIKLTIFPTHFFRNEICPKPRKKVTSNVSHLNFIGWTPLMSLYAWTYYFSNSENPNLVRRWLGRGRERCTMGMAILLLFQLIFYIHTMHSSKRKKGLRRYAFRIRWPLPNLIERPFTPAKWDNANEPIL